MDTALGGTYDNFLHDLPDVLVVDDIVFVDD